MNNDIYKDSLGQCQTYSNPYDLRHAGRSELKEHRKEIYRRDSMESSMDQIEKQAWKRLLGFGSENSNSQLVMVARAGKLLFLCIALPPYIFFYGLPKWLLFNGFPNSLKFLQDKAPHLNRNGNRLIQIQENFNKQLLRITQLLKSIRSGTVKMLTPIGKGMMAILSQLKKLGEAVDNGKDYIQKKIEETRNALLRMNDKIIAGLYNAIDRTKAGVEALQQKLKVPMEWLKKQDQRVSNFIRPKIQIVVKGAKLLTTPFVKAYELAKRAYEKVSEPVERFAERVAERGRAIAERVGDHLNKVRKAIEHAGNKVSENVQQVYAVTAAAVINLVQAIPLPTINIMTPIQAGAKKFGSGFNRFAAKIHKIGEKMRYLGSLLGRGFATLQQKIKQGFILVLPLIKTVPMLIWRLLKSVFALILLVIRGFLYGVRLTLVWGYILIRYGFRLMREIAVDKGLA